MSSSPRQIVFADPAPSNQLPIAGTPEEMLITFPIATLSGSSIVIIGCVSNFAGTTINGALDPVNGAYTSVDDVLDAGNLDIHEYVFENAASVPAGANGAISSSTVSSITDTSQSWTTNQWAGATLYLPTSGSNVTVSSNTGTTLVFPALGGAPTAGSPYAVGGYVAVKLTAFDDFTSMTLVEVQGVVSSPLAGHSSAKPASGGSGTNNISSGTAALGSSPVGMLGFCCNISGNNTPAVPLAGSAFTNEGSSWAWNVGAVQARLEWRNFASPGTQAALFSAQDSDTFATFMIAFTDSGAGAAIDAGHLPQPGPGISPIKSLQFQAPKRDISSITLPTSGNAYSISISYGIMGSAGSPSGNSYSVSTDYGQLQGAGAIPGFITSASNAFGQLIGTGGINGIAISASTDYGNLPLPASDGRIPTAGPGIGPDQRFQFSKIILDSTLGAAPLANIAAVSISISTDYGTIIASGALLGQSYSESTLYGFAQTGLQSLSASVSLSFGQLTSVIAASGEIISASTVYGQLLPKGALFGFSTSESILYAPAQAQGGNSLFGVCYSEGISYGALRVGPAPSGYKYMIDVTGMELFMAINTLISAQIVQPQKIGYFGTFPITAKWTPYTPIEPGWVTAQSLAVGFLAKVNSPITLTVSEYPVGVAFP